MKGKHNMKFIFYAFIACVFLGIWKTEYNFENPHPKPRHAFELDELPW